VLEATSGVEALAQIAEHAVDLILLDVMLDALDGFQLCSAIRRNPRVGSIPIVILSGRETDDDRARGESVGVDAYLTKPFQPRELLDVVYAQMRDSVDGTSP
jgi:twitching motility two-component system response regulator PilG